jgi:hypothetical protein
MDDVAKLGQDFTNCPGMSKPHAWPRAFYNCMGLNYCGSMGTINAEF